MNRMPKFYVPPFGTPVYWRDEQSGVLVAAIEAYMDSRIIRKGPQPTAEQIELIRDFFLYFIKAPCWASGFEMNALIKQAEKIQTGDDIAEWIHAALEIGIDPL